MKDDLISRNKIMEEAKELSGPYTGEGWDNWGVYALIERQPSVRAIPLDKLCEWLAKNASWYASEIDGDPEEWKSILTEWMEELHG